MKKIVKTARKYPFSVICIILIWYLCLLLDVPETPLSNVAFIDKWTHFLMYGGTCSVIWWEYLRHHQSLAFSKLFLWAFLAPIAMSGVIELLQNYCTTTRAGEWLDFAANSTGVALGNAVGLLLHKIKATD